MKYLLFENSIPLITTLIIIVILTIFVFRKIPDDIKKKIIILSGILIPLLFTIEKLVDTEKELIFKEILLIQKSITSKPIDNLNIFFDETIIVKYRSKDYNKEEFIDFLEEKLIDKQIQVFDIKKHSFSVKNKKNQVMILVVMKIITQNGVAKFPIKFNTVWKGLKIVKIDFNVPLIRKK